MPPNEQKILANYLITPASLPAIISFHKFSSQFPSAARSSHEVKRLYRSLQHKRALLTDSVASAIAQEARRGDAQRKAVIHSRRLAEDIVTNDEEILIERCLYGQTSNLPVVQSHSLDSILLELQTAEKDLEAEIAALEQEAKVLLSEMTATVGGLSDLRYGKFENGQINEDVIQSLKGLDAIVVTK